MNAARLRFCAVIALGWLTLAAIALRPTCAVAATEETFPLLQIGTHVYKNVTVTSKAKDYIFILYEGGMTSIKTSDLPPDLREKLGYNEAEKAAAAASTNSASAWAKAEVAKLESGKVKDMQKQIVERWKANQASGKPAWGVVATLLPMSMLLTIGGILMVTYLFHCLCFMLICRKAGCEPGVLVWLPIVQLIPLLRAAQMPLAWFVFFLLPGISIIPLIVWCFKIAEARGKSPLTGLLLLLPITGLFAFLYLAFSSGSARKEAEESEPEIMSLQTA